MPSWIMELVMLVTALSMDAFAAGFLYGAGRVKIPPASALTISGISSGMLLLSLQLGTFAQGMLPEKTAGRISFLILFALAGAKLFDSSIKSLIRRHGAIRKQMDKEWKVSALNLHLVLSVYADAEKANPDDSILTPAEALSLGAALSLDSGLAGIGAGMVSRHLWTAILLSMAANMAAVGVGCVLGRRAAGRSRLNLSWVSSLLLLALAFGRLFS